MPNGQVWRPSKVSETNFKNFAKKMLKRVDKLKTVAIIKLSAKKEGHQPPSKPKLNSRYEWISMDP
ncbi:MAG: hypothetical protein F6J93_19365 [Oscillatoria sp. SIO1A7]|nr:hypothetical protein [Oscillatoria sp. SIO1A7]